MKCHTRRIARRPKEDIARRPKEDNEEMQF